MLLDGALPAIPVARLPSFVLQYRPTEAGVPADAG